jgi:hypothetical protein
MTHLSRGWTHLPTIVLRLFNKGRHNSRKDSPLRRFSQSWRQRRRAFGRQSDCKDKGADDENR